MIRYYVTDTDLNEAQFNWLKERGYHFYTMRDEGGITPGIGWVNRYGLMITDTEIPIEDGWMDESDFFNRDDIQEISWYEIEEPFRKYANINFFFHIKGNLYDEEYIVRTYDISIAKRKVKEKMDFVKRSDPHAKAYRFGYGRDKNAYWKVRHKMESNKNPKEYYARFGMKYNNGVISYN